VRGIQTLLLIAIGALAAACGGSKGPGKPTFDAAAGLDEVKTARAALSSARSTLDATRAELALLAAKAKLSRVEQAHKAELERQVREDQAAFDRAYDADQRTLTRFLNVVLNELPNAPETREALALYAAQAIRNANDLITNNGDYAKAIELLVTAENTFTAIRAQVPADLRRELDSAKALRYLSRDRFDRVRNGMSTADTRLITGTPFYANVREHEDRGGKITTWQFAREDGGVAAVQFQNGKVVARIWDVK